MSAGSFGEIRNDLKTHVGPSAKIYRYTTEKTKEQFVQVFDVLFALARTRARVCVCVCVQSKVPDKIQQGHSGSSGPKSEKVAG